MPPYLLFLIGTISVIASALVIAIGAIGARFSRPR
jgi:hypothetical protein